MILITGGSGFIGTNLLELLISQKNDVINFDINPPRNKSHKKYWIEGDIRNFKEVEDVIEKFKPKYIIHLAARTDLHGENLNDYSANIDGVKNILKSTQKNNHIKLLLLASSRLVCKIGYLPKGDNDYCPNTLYGESKMRGEELVRRYSTSISYPWMIFRPTSIWGPWFETPYREFFMSIIHGHYIHPCNYSIKKSFGYVGNTVFAIAHLLENFPIELNKKTIYMCDYEPIDVLQWAKNIASSYGVKPPIEVDPLILRIIAKGGDLLKKIGYIEPPLTSFRLNNLLADMVYDTSVLQRYCGPLPFTQEEGIEETLSWLRQQS